MAPKIVLPGMLVIAMRRGRAIQGAGVQSFLAILATLVRMVLLLNWHSDSSIYCQYSQLRKESELMPIMQGKSITKLYIYFSTGFILGSLNQTHFPCLAALMGMKVKD